MFPTEILSIELTLKDIAIIGAGLAGLTAAAKLNKHARVKVFEKSRGVGGRLSNRRAAPFRFDHGAQFFKSKSNEFSQFIEPMIQAGVVQRWNARIVEIDGGKITGERRWDDDNPHFVGVPGMNSFVKYLAEDIDVVAHTQVAPLQKHHNKWELQDQHGNSLGRYDWVIAAAPAPQTALLLPDCFLQHELVKSVKFSSCFALMLGFDQPLSLAFDAARVNGSAVAWMAVDSSKPGREGPFSLVVHSSADWAEKHFNEDRGEVLEELCQETTRLIGHDVNGASSKDLHGWRYALCEEKAGPKSFVDPEHCLAACGDWCIGGRVEAAFHSGRDAAECILRIIK